MNDPGMLSQEAIYAGMDAVLAAVPVDLCAYLHLPVAAGPQLFLRRPELSALDPSTAFQLFTSLRDAAEHGDTDVPGFYVTFVRSAGPSSRGLHAVGRRDGKLDDTERAVVEAVCTATAKVAHALAPEERTMEPVRVSVEIAGESVKAEVEVLLDGRPSTGRANHDTAHEAVAAAALGALGTGLALSHAKAVELDDDRVAIVLVEGAGARRLGAALYPSTGDPLVAFAGAALEAAARFPRHD